MELGIPGNVMLGSDDSTTESYFLLPNRDHTSAMSGYVNVTSPYQNDTAPAVRDEKLAKIEIAIQAVIFVCAVFGNACVLVALRYRKRKTSRMHVFIMHLSIADLMVAFLNILPQMIWDITFRFQGSDVMCRFVKYFQVFVIYLSTYILVMTAIDRYRAICYPISTYSWTNKKINLMIAAAWGLAALLSLPQPIIFKLQVVPKTEDIDCWGNFHPEWTVRVYITSFALAVFLIPSLILVVLYGRICYVVWTNVRQRNSESFDSESEAEVSSRCSSIRKNSSLRCNEANGIHRFRNGAAIRYKFTGKPGQISVIQDRGNHGEAHAHDWGRSHCRRGISRSKMKTIKLTFVVIIAYMLCWAPFIIAQLWWAYDQEAPIKSKYYN